MDKGPIAPEAPLTPATSWGAEEPLGAAGDVFARYGPPFDITADLLFGLALCPSGPLRRAFPGVPFLGLLGRTPLLVWFARITRGCYFDASGRRRCDGGPAGVLYHELNVLALLRRPALFVPGIYATSPRSVRIGRRYGMPKQATTMSFQADGRRLSSCVLLGDRWSTVEARVLGPGRVLAGLLAPWLPRRVWPIEFPSGSRIRGTITAVPRVHFAHVMSGRLDFEAAWLPGPLSLLPLGVYTPDMRMRLPPLEPSAERYERHG